MTASTPLAERAADGLHAHLAALVRSRGPATTARVLDIGCGSGAFLARLASQGFSDLHGLDREPPAPLPGITVRAFELDRDDPGEGAGFDLVTCIEVIEHVENIGRLLDAIRLWLKPDGLAIITTPNVESLVARLRSVIVGQWPQFDDRADPTHIIPVLRASLAKMLAHRDMRIEATFGYPVDPLATTMYSRRTMFARRLLGPLLTDDAPGDIAIHLIRHDSTRTGASK